MVTAITTTPVPGGTARLRRVSTNQIVGTSPTDADGFYQIVHKHTGKTANYTAVMPAYNVKQVVPLKANGFAVVLFENLP